MNNDSISFELSPITYHHLNSQQDEISTDNQYNPNKLVTREKLPTMSPTPLYFIFSLLS